MAGRGGGRAAAATLPHAATAVQARVVALTVPRPPGVQLYPGGGADADLLGRLLPVRGGRQRARRAQAAAAQCSLLVHAVDTKWTAPEDTGHQRAGRLLRGGETGQEFRDRVSRYPALPRPSLFCRAAELTAS